MSQTPVAVGAIGMVASLGLDAPTCCAAARAGILRSRKLSFAFNDVRAKAVEHAVGHPAPFLTEGFEGSTRLARLLAGALQDLRTRIGPLPSRTGFYLSLPSRFRRLTGAEIVANEEVRNEMQEAAAQCGSEQPFDDAAALLRLAGSLIGWPVPQLRFATTVGHSGVAEAVAKAADDLGSGAIEAAIVAGVDSLLEEESLVWLRATGRLKTSSVPAGLMPGEAAAVFVIQALEPRQRNYTRITANCVKREATSFLEGGAPLGRALAEVASQASLLRPSEDKPVWIIADLNGEPYRAIDWGNALVRTQSTIGDPLLWCPAVSFGDSGAVSGAIAVCLAYQAWAQGYAPASWSIITSASDGPQRAALCMASNGRVQ